MFRKVIVFLMVLSVVSSATVVGPASAVSSDEVCSGVDLYLSIITLGYSGTCSEDIDSNEYEEMQKLDANQTHMDYYVAYSGTRTNSEIVQNTLDGYTQDTRTSAFIRAENESVNKIWADAPITEINQTVINSTDDYYSESQYARLVSSWNQEMKELEYYIDRVKNESEITETDLMTYTVDDTGDGLADGTWWFEYVNISSPDGNNTFQVYVLKMDSGNHVYYSTPDGSNGYTDFDWYWTMEPPAGSGEEPIHIYNSTGTSMAKEYQAVWNNIESNQLMVRDNALAWANTLNDAEAAGTITVDDYVSPYLMAQEWTTDYNTTGYWSYAVARMAAAGMDMPDLNGTSHFDVNVSDETESGLLVSSEPPENETWINGEEYDTANMSGKVFMISGDGNITELNGTFTIEDMQDKNGSSVNETTTVKYIYEETNISDYEEMQQRILDLQKEIEAMESTLGGASDGTLPFGLTRGQAAAGAGGAGLLLYLMGASKRRRY